MATQPPVCESRRAVLLMRAPAPDLSDWRCCAHGVYIRTRRETRRWQDSGCWIGGWTWSRTEFHHAAICGSRSGARLKRPWPATRYLVAPYRPRFSIIPASAPRCPIRSDSASAKAPAIDISLSAVANEAFAASPDLVDAASRDLDVIVLNDPASTGPVPALLNFKGYVALQTWRVSNWLWRAIGAILHCCCKASRPNSLQVSIHPSASIGTSVFLDHATGIVVGSFVTIGDEVTIQQNVTVGRKAESPNRAPRIGRGVLLSTGATILGDVSIGDFAKIGAGAVVTSDVPSGCTAVGVPAAPDQLPRRGSRLGSGGRRESTASKGAQSTSAAARISRRQNPYGNRLLTMISVWLGA